MTDDERVMMADQIGDLIYNGTQLARSDAGDLAWDVLHLIEGGA